MRGKNGGKISQNKYVFMVGARRKSQEESFEKFYNFHSLISFSYTAMLPHERTEFVALNFSYNDEKEGNFHPTFNFIIKKFLFMLGILRIAIKESLKSSQTLFFRVSVETTVKNLSSTLCFEYKEIISCFQRKSIASH
jgi:hypothetical protein